MVAVAAAKPNKSFGPERLVLLHSPDPIDLGLRLEYSIADGRVRIVYTEDNNDNGINNNGGVVEGTVHNGDVVLEAAGVNMRRPISDHMWQLTEGLMKVAPRPIEIVVATEMEGGDEDAAMTTKTNITSEMDQDGMASVYGASVYGTYYQLEMGENARTTDATLHQLPGEERNPSEEDLQPSEVVRNPFQDIDRFGTERRIVFHTQSLGVKLHRSPSEGIVHILTVTPYKPFGGANSNDTTDGKPAREGPDNGHIEAGDTIFEVGGVDLRGKVIGKLEWADMVHFIKYVHRPLDMIVAKDNLFTLERAGVTKDVVDDLSNAEAEEEVVVGQEVVLVQNNEGIDEQRDGPDTNNDHQEHSQMFDNTCFNIAVDDICNLPCGGGRSSTVTTSPTREDSSWIKPSQPETKIHPWNKKKDGHDEDTESAIDEVASSTNKYEPSIISIVEENEQDVAAPNENNRPTTMHFFSRTDPKGKPSSVVQTSPVVPISPITVAAATTTTSSSSGAANTVVESEVVVDKKLTVSQLREMFSPIQSISPGDSASIANTNDDNIAGSPILKPTTDCETSEKEQSNRTQLNGLFSPIVTDDVAPKSPMDDTDHLPLGQAMFHSTSAPDSPGDWSTKSPLSDKSVVESPDADSDVVVEHVADVLMAEAMNENDLEDATQSMVHADSSVKDVAPSATNIDIDKEDPPSAEDESRPAEDVMGECPEGLVPPATNSRVIKEEQATVHSIVEATSSDSMPGSRPHMPFYARTHPKGKSSVVQQSSPVRTSPISRTVVATKDRIQAPTPESFPPKPYDETNDSSFHSTVLHDLKDDFNSHDKALQSPESRDDRAEEVGKKSGVVGSLNSNQIRPDWSIHHHQERHDLSPTGSTVSVEDKTATAKKSSADATFFNERFFNTMDAADSPFVGNIKFATPNQRVPASALFSEAFLVQKPSNINNEPINVRWVQTDSPLFVTKKLIDDQCGDGVVKKRNVGKVPSSYQEFHPPSRSQPPIKNDDELLPVPDVKRFNNLSAFDMTNLEGGLSLIDCDPESENPSFELNETIVYADSTEEAQKQCCAMSNLCGSDNMFEGLVQNCVDNETHRQTKERVNKIPSPRRKNILERIRNKKKKNKKLESTQMEYGNLDDNDDHSSGEQNEEKMKGIRKAKVQLTFQNMRGQTLASAKQFALLMDDEISF